MRRLALALGVSLCLLIVAGIGAYILLQPSYLAPALALAVKEATGKDLSFAGPPRLALWPEVAVVYSEAAIGGGEGKLLRIGELRLVTRLGALLSRRVEIERVDLVEPHLELRVGQDGAANWDMPAGDSPSLRFTISGGSLSYLDDRYGHRFQADGIRAAGVFGEQGASLTLKGGIVWNSQAAGIDLYVKSAQRFAADGSPVTVRIDGASGQFGFEGRAAVTWGFGLAGQAKFAAPDLRAFLKWIGLPLAGSAGFKNVSLTGAMDATAGQVTFKQATLGLDGASATGDLNVKLAKNGPSLEGALAFDRLDLNIYMPWIDDAGWRAAALDFSAFKSWGGKLAITTKNATAGVFALRGVAFDAALENGRLAIGLEPVELFGGKVSANVTLDGAGAEPTAVMTLNLAGIAAGPLRARTDLTFSADAMGSTPEAMISRLTGYARFAASDGAIEGFDAVALLARASEAIVEGWGEAKNGTTPFTSLGANFQIADGIMTTADGALRSQAIDIPFTGDIDLLRAAVDLKFAPVLAGGAGLPVAVVARGPWAAPRLFADIPGILENPEAAYRALKKLGLPQSP